MIFSAEKWNNAGEIKAFVKVSNSLSFSVMETPLRDAFDLFILPLVGYKMGEKLKDIYASPERKESEKRALELAQRANACLAFWYSFDELNTRITDSGFQRQESENGTFKQAYKYQEDNLRNGFRNKGWNAVDALLDYLEANITDFGEYADSPAHTTLQTDLVKTTAEVDMYYHINHSRIIFMRLQNHFRFVTKMILPTVIGQVIYDKLEAHLKSPEESADTMENLRKQCLGFVILSAVKRLMAETGSITDRGLYFSELTDKEGNETLKPVADERLTLQLDNLQSDIDRYQASLMQYIKHHFETDYKGSPMDVFKRDNDHKSTFFA